MWGRQRAGVSECRPGAGELWAVLAATQVQKTGAWRLPGVAGGGVTSVSSVRVVQKLVKRSELS